MLSRSNVLMKVVSLIVICVSFSNCTNKKNEAVVEGLQFDIGGFEPIINYGKEIDSIFTIDINWQNAIKGIVIPSNEHTESGYFKFRFTIKNKTGKSARFRYSIFYQNESYKFIEKNDSTEEYFKFQSENFYGNWDLPNQGLKITDQIEPDGEFHQIIDSFRIVGNPRFEDKYFSDGINHMWKRNPRMGTYEFCLFVCPDNFYKEKKLPQEFTDLSISKNGIYTNPFDFTKYRIKDNTNTSTVYSNKKLNVKAKLDLSTIYANPENFNKNFDESFICNTCNYNQTTKDYACFEQFKPVIISDTYLKNIPLILNVNNNEYTIEDYYWNKNYTMLEERIFTIPMRPRTPCESVKYNKDQQCIELRNPASKPFDWRKEISGVKTRHGLSYGKFRVKCKLTRLLNDKNMWNGITNAIWLINQSLEPWNNIRPCKNGGYMAEYLGDENSQRSEVISYSEIDFEIIKALPYCPNCQFPPYFTKTIPEKSKYDYWSAKQPPEIEKESDKIFIACTNWDMACESPSKHAGGCVTSRHSGKEFSFFRWAKSSRGVTGGELMSDKEIFGAPFYYFEIEWKPTEIIWKIGPSPDKMKEICYMDSSYTSIPNNQMLLIIDQEFHNTKWWYGAQFEQENIPFPSEEIVGKIYEVTIE